MLSSVAHHPAMTRTGKRHRLVDQAGSLLDLVEP